MSYNVNEKTTWYFYLANSSTYDSIILTIRSDSGYRYEFSQAKDKTLKIVARTRDNVDFLRKIEENAKPLPFGAGRENRTLAERLEIFRSTTKLYPRLYIILSKMMLNSAFRVKYNYCRRVETGRQARLRSVWSNPWRFDSSRRHRTFKLFFAKISILLCRSSQDGHGTGLKNLGYWFESNLRHPLKAPHYCGQAYARVAQLVEHLLAKEKVAGSSPVSRSKNAAVVELVYTQDLKSCGLKNHVGSIPASGTLGDWRNWLACMVWDHEVAGSNPVSPTNYESYSSSVFQNSHR